MPASLGFGSIPHSRPRWDRFSPKWGCPTVPADGASPLAQVLVPPALASPVEPAVDPIMGLDDCIRDHRSPLDHAHGKQGSRINPIPMIPARLCADTYL